MSDQAKLLQLEVMIKQSLFLRGSLELELIAQLPVMSDKDLRELETMLLDSRKEEDEIFLSFKQNDPKFMIKFNMFTHALIDRGFLRQDITELQKAQQIIQKL